MGLVVKKRQLLSATMVIALAAAVAVNWYYTNTQSISDSTETTYNYEQEGNLGDSVLVQGTAVDTNAAQTASDYSADEYFASAELEREKVNDSIRDSIDEILGKANLSDDDKIKLENLYSEYQDTIKKQNDAENLIKAKTSSRCVVIINDGTCQVVMEKNSLNDTVILQITEIIEKNTNISAENLTIIETK